MDVSIVNGARTPIGKFGGMLKDTPAVDLGAHAIEAAIKRANIQKNSIQNVIMGAIHLEGMGNNPCRIASLKAGIPPSAGALTVNNVCSSGMKAVEIGAHEILLEEYEVVIAGGMESNSQTPYMELNMRWGSRLDNKEVVDALFYDGFTDTYGVYGGYDHVGETAENILENAKKISVKYDLPLIELSFEEINQFALNSQKKYQDAKNKGFFQEIAPIEMKSKKGTKVVSDDESPRPEVTVEKLNQLTPVFREGGFVTPGNTPDLNDGAAALVLMSHERCNNLDIKPLGYWRSSAAGNVEPKYMGLGPIPAIRNLFKKTGLSKDDIDIFEINEAQAQQVLFCMRALQLDENKVNVNGGAIAIGHPPGMTGARMILTALNELNRRRGRYAICAMCAGGGTGMATLVENTG